MQCRLQEIEEGLATMSKDSKKKERLHRYKNKVESVAVVAIEITIRLEQTAKSLRDLKPQELILQRKRMAC